MNYGNYCNQQLNNININGSISKFSEMAEKNNVIDNSIYIKNEEEKRKKSSELNSLLNDMKLQMSNEPSPFQAGIQTGNVVQTSNNLINQYSSYPNPQSVNLSYNNNKETHSDIPLINSNSSSNCFSLNQFSLSKIPMNSTKYVNLEGSNINKMASYNQSQNNQNSFINIQQPNMNFNQIQNNSNSNYLIQVSVSQKIENEQDKRDKLNKALIIERHSIELSNFYEYPPEERDKHVVQLLKDINYLGEINKKEMKREKSINKDKYISIEEAFQNNKHKKINGFNNEFYVLALLGKALQIQGCSVLIEKNFPENLEQNKEMNTTIQFLANGMYNFIKYIFYFDLGEGKHNKLLKDLNERNNFNLKLRKKLHQIFNLAENDIIMTNIRFDPYSVTAIIKQEKFTQYSTDNLIQFLRNDIEFNRIKFIEKGILLSACKLNPYMLDSRGNNKDGKWGFNELRGGKPYNPPNGWVGYGLRIADRYDNGDNSWIDYNNSKNEWSVAYQSIGSESFETQLNTSNTSFNIFNSNISNPGIKKQYKDFNDFYHLGYRVGEGIIITPKPEIMEKNCRIFDCYGKKYKIGFMTRVMPKKIRRAENQEDYWVINGTDNEIRPYRILIKEL